jgi:hypothetical protein
MNVLSSFPPAEQARQLANSEGALGIEIAECLIARPQSAPANGETAVQGADSSGP